MAELASYLRGIGDTSSILRAVAGELDDLANHTEEDVSEILQKVAGIVRIEALRVEAGWTRKGAHGP